MIVDMKIEGLEEYLSKFSRQTVELAVMRAINRAADQTLTEASANIRETYNISATDLRKELRLAKDSGRLTATISARGLGLPLSKFGAKQEGAMVKTFRSGGTAFRYMALKKKFGNRGGAVTVEVRKDSGRKTVTTDPKAFMTQMRSGHIGVMKREGKSRYPIRERYGPGPAKMLRNRVLLKKLKEFFFRIFEPRFQQELKYLMSKGKF